MNNNLPPELVEKFKLIIPVWDYYNDTQRDIEDIHNDLNKCAQIAVDYADELQVKLSILEIEASKLLHNNWELRRQRDELIEALKNVYNQFQAMPEGYDPGNCSGEIALILKKHEDGN